MAGSDVTRVYKIRYQTEDKASQGINGLQGNLKALDATSAAATARLKALTDQTAWLGNASSNTSQLVDDLTGSLAKLGLGASTRLGGIASSMGRVDFNATTATKNVEAMNAALQSTGATAGGVQAVQAAVQSTQRSTYGLWKNAQEAAGALGQVAAQAPGLQTAGVAAGELSASLKITSTESKATGSSFNGMMVALMALQGADHVIDAIAESTRSAREETEGWAGEALKLRDELRELANLQGKPGADDAVMAAHLQMRVETGMTSTEARKFDEQFRGSLPLARDAGGIDDQTASGLAVGVGKLAVRTGLDGGTAGDLAGVMGAFGSVPDAHVGLGRAQQIVDLLNDGRGNLTPLVKELMKDAGSTTGEGKMFRNLQERAAAISTSTALGSIGRSSTRINQAIAGLSGFDKSQGDALRLHGIKDTDDFLTRIRKIAPLVRFAKREGRDPLGVLAENGFANQTEQKAIVGFVENLDALEKRTKSVREDRNAPDAKARVAADRSATLNDQFLTGDKAARNRVAEARLQATKLQRGKPLENVEIERKEAEARLQARKEIDTPESNMMDAARGGFGLSEKLGMPSGRQVRIDNEIKRRAIEAAQAQLGRKLTRDEQAEFDGSIKKSADFLSNRRAFGGRPAGDVGKVNPGRVPLPGNGPDPAANPGKAAAAKGKDPGAVAAPKGGLNGPNANNQLNELVRGINKLVNLATRGATKPLPAPGPVVPFR